MKKIKKIVLLATTFILATGLLAGCGSNSEEKDASAEKTEITVLAAASLTDALDEIIAEYEKDNDVEILASYAGSGDLVQQIEGGAPCDLFISASKANMDQLEEQNLIDKESRKDLLGNRLTLIATEEKADTITMDTLTKDATGSIAIGEEETVPAGKYASQVFDNMKIADQIKDKIIRAKDVRAVLNYVDSGDADCGFVYRTDALMAESAKIIGDVEEDLHDPIVYPAALIAEAPQAEAAAAFYDFLETDFANEAFEKYGFTVK